MPVFLKSLSQALVVASVMALISVALRFFMRLALPMWEASPPRFGALTFWYLPALVAGGYLSARFLAPRSVVVAMAGGFVFMSLVSWSRGARPWWYAVVRIPAIVNAVSTRW